MLNVNCWYGNLFSIWYKVEELCIRDVVVDEIPVLESSVQVVAAVDFVRVVVNRHGMKEIVPSEVDPIHVYRKPSCICVVSHQVGVALRISEQLQYERFLTWARVHNANQRFRHVGWNEFKKVKIQFNENVRYRLPKLSNVHDISKLRTITCSSKSSVI